MRHTSVFLYRLGCWGLGMDLGLENDGGYTVSPWYKLSESILLSFFPALGVLTFVPASPLKKTTCCVHIPAP
jgi:hypothetical protein